MDQITLVYLMSWLRQTTVANVPLINISFAVAATIVAYLAMTLALRVAVNRLTKIASHTNTKTDDFFVEVLRGTKNGLIALVALLIGVGLLDLPERWGNRVHQLWFVVLVLQLALWANRIVSMGMRQYAERHTTPGTQAVSAAATLMSWGLRTLVWSVVLLAMLSNLGINITAFCRQPGRRRYRRGACSAEHPG